MTEKSSDITLVESRVGNAVRSARRRAELTREALAFHSGLSWAAIAQIESGRRREVRVSSLLALAKALGVSIDYLVGNEAMTAPNLLEHRGLLYRSDEELLAEAVPYLEGGVAQGESVLVVTTTRRIGLLRDGLGDNARHVEFHGSKDWYRSPRRAMDSYHFFIKERFERGVPWIWILGEPPVAGKPAAEVKQWTRYESLINLSFATAPASILCPYDASALPDSVVASVRQTHPEVASRSLTLGDGAYREPTDFLLSHA